MFHLHPWHPLMLAPADVEGRPQRDARRRQPRVGGGVALVVVGVGVVAVVAVVVGLLAGVPHDRLGHGVSLLDLQKGDKGDGLSAVVPIPDQIFAFGPSQKIRWMALAHTQFCLF